MTPSSLALPHHVTGQVVSVNKPAKLFTLKTADGATMLLAADGGMLPQFSTLKKGERVKVTYKNSQGQSVATKITPA
jgi:ferredoxin-NADP reductase